MAKSALERFNAIMNGIDPDEDTAPEAEINIDALCEYVREYLKYAPLTESDLIAMPYLYLYQLFRSRYGYTQYLITKTANCDQLIEFAFRRTAICRDIESKAERIAERLAKI